MTKRTWAVLTMLSLFGCGDDADEPTPPERYVLVHGAWMGAWAWSDVAQHLEAGGARVTTVELPGHGADATPPTMVTLDAYVTTVVDALDEPSIVVGHSMAGMVITEAADRAPDRITELVYVAAYVPKAGETLQSLAGMDAGSHVGPVLMIDPEAGTASLPQTALRDVFCADCSDAQLATLEANYRDEPLFPFTGESQVGSRWAGTSKHYVYTTQDNAVSYAFQQSMTADVAFASTATLDTSHSPMLSQPALLGDVLLDR